MTWFEAYILWNLNSFAGAVIAIATILMFANIPLTIFYFVNSHEMNDYCDNEDSRYYKLARYWKTFCARWLRITAPAMVVMFLLAVVIPTTETVLKIIATKKGIEAVQSDTAHKYLGEIDKAVTNGMKVLNQEIEKKLDKKEAK